MSGARYCDLSALRCLAQFFPGSTRQACQIRMQVPQPVMCMLTPSGRVARTPAEAQQEGSQR
eukprot:366244-Alexandrium_andersonii.AAC.1